jgi:hypothetical protein
MLSGVYRFPAMESVVFGKPYADALAQEVDRLDSRAVFVLASGTLARETDLVERLRQMLGNRFAGPARSDRGGFDARPLDSHQPAQNRRSGGHSYTARRRLVDSEFMSMSMTRAAASAAAPIPYST